MQSLSIVVPAYNEAARLPATLELLLAWLHPRRFQFAEVLVVDDGSRDATAAFVEEFSQKHPCVRLLRNPGNRGKGYAVRHGMSKAAGDWILFTDADLSTPIEEVDTLFARLQASAAVAAIGSRALDRSLVEVRQSAFREASGQFFNLVMRAVTGLPFLDTQCGFKLYHSSAARQIFPRQRLDGFSFDVEDLYIARRRGLSIVEVPVHWRNVEGTKVGALSGLRSFADLLRIRANAARGLYD